MKFCDRVFRDFLVSILLMCVFWGIVTGQTVGTDKFSSNSGNQNKERPFRDVLTIFPGCAGLVQEYWNLTDKLHAKAEERRRSVDPRSRQITKEVNVLAKKRSEVGRAIQDCVREGHKEQKQNRQILLKGKIEKDEVDPQKTANPVGEKPSDDSGPPGKAHQGQPPERKKPENTGPRGGPIPPHPPNLPGPPREVGQPDPGPKPPTNPPRPLPPLGPPGRAEKDAIPKKQKGTTTKKGGIQDKGNGNTQNDGTQEDRRVSGNGNGEYGARDKKNCVNNEDNEVCKSNEDEKKLPCNLRQLAELVNQRYGTNPIAIYRVTNRGPNTFLMTLAGTELLWVFQANNSHMAIRAYVAGVFQDPNDPYMRKILQALETLPDGSNLIIVGHSQGGMQGLNVLPYLAKSLEHRGFGVDQVVTFGSPITQLHAGRADIRFVFVEVEWDPIPWGSLINHPALRVSGFGPGNWVENHNHYKDSVELENYDMLGIKGGRACIDIDLNSIVTFDAKAIQLQKAPSSPCNGRGPSNSSGPYRLDGITTAQLQHDHAIQKMVFDAARELQQIRDAEGRHLLKELNIQGGLTYAVLKRDTPEDFVIGILEKMNRKGYSSLSEVPDAVRGRFNLPDWESVEQVAKALEEQHPHIEPSHTERPRKTKPHGIFHRYPRYHLVLKGPCTLLLHEWQIGTLATSVLFEAPNFGYPSIPVPPLLKQAAAKWGKEFNGDLHDIEYDLFQSYARKNPETADRLGIRAFIIDVAGIADQTVDGMKAIPHLEREIYRLHEGAARLLQKLVEEEGPDKIVDYFH